MRSLRIVRHAILFAAKWIVNFKLKTLSSVGIVCQENTTILFFVDWLEIEPSATCTGLWLSFDSLREARSLCLFVDHCARIVSVYDSLPIRAVSVGHLWVASAERYSVWLDIAVKLGLNLSLRPSNDALWRAILDFGYPDRNVLILRRVAVVCCSHVFLHSIWKSTGEFLDILHVNLSNSPF